MERRSDDTGIAACGLTGLSAPTDEMRTNINSGIDTAMQMRTIRTQGGRQAKGGARPGGGGYLNVCTTSKLADRAEKKFPRDPRLDILRKMGMHHTWQKIAAEIGMDAFLAMWRILDDQQQFHHPKGGLEFSLRRYRSYTHYQRDDFIRQLAAAGLNPQQIHERLGEALCEKMNPTRIKQIINNK